MKCTRYFTRVTRLKCHETFFFFVTVTNQKSALATWGMKEPLCFMLVCDGNKARAKTILHFYTVFQVCDSFICSFQYFVIMSMHF